MKKVLDNDKRGPKVNEVLYWKSRFKESEKEKGKVLETLNSTVRKLESETKSNDLLRKQLSIVHIHNARIPDILADLTADIKNNADLNSHMRKNSVRVRAKTSPNSSGVYDNNETVSRAPRTAATVAEQNRTNTRAKADLDASLNKSSSKTR